MRTMSAGTPTSGGERRSPGWDHGQEIIETGRLVGAALARLVLRSFLIDTKVMNKLIGVSKLVDA